MQRRNWLQLSRKLVDQFDLDYTLAAMQMAMGELASNFWGEGVLETLKYPDPFPITLSGVTMGGTVGNGIAYDPNGQHTEIYTASPTTKDFVIPAAHATLYRHDLLVLVYKMTGDTPVPKPSDPIVTIDLNLHDDFELAVRPGVPSGSPSYPAKQLNDIILSGIIVPPAVTLGNQCVLDLSIRELASPFLVKEPIFKSYQPAGAVDGVNQNFTLTTLPLNNNSLLVYLDDILLPITAWVRSGLTITLSTAPAPGQTLWVWYVENNNHSENPLSGVQESLGTGNGVQTVYPLISGIPANQASLQIFVDGMIVPTTEWDFTQTPTQASVTFHAGSIPAAAQDVYAFYLVNAESVGVGGGGGGSGAYAAFGSQATPVTVNPGVGIGPSTDARQAYFVRSVTGAQTVTANPQIGPGMTVGQEIALIGTSATNYPIFSDGTGLSLNGPVSLTNNGAITLIWNGSTWTEQSRR